MAKIVSGPTVTGTAITADDSLFLAENSIPYSGSAVRRMHFALGGTAMTLANVTRITHRAQGVPFIDAPPAMFRAYYGFIGKKAEWDTTATRFTVDYGLLGGGAPPSQLLRVTTSKNATPSGSVTLNLHQYLDESPVGGYPKFISNAANIPANATTQNFPIQVDGVIQGIYLPDVANVTLLRYFDEGGLVYEWTSSAQLLEAFQLYRGTTAVTELYIPVRPSIVRPGVTRVEISTGASWAGASNEIGVHTVIPTRAA